MLVPNIMVGLLEILFIGFVPIVFVEPVSRVTAIFMQRHLPRRSNDAYLVLHLFSFGAIHRVDSGFVDNQKNTTEECDCGCWPNMGLCIHRR